MTKLPAIRTDFSRCCVPPLKGRGKLVRGDGSDNPSQLVLKLSCDSEGPVGSDFTPREEKKSGGTRSGEKGGWRIILTFFDTRNYWTQAAVWIGVLF